MDKIINTINLLGWVFVVVHVGLSLFVDRDSFLSSDISLDVWALQGVQLFQITEIVLILIGVSKGSILGAFMQISARNIVSLVFISAESDKLKFATVTIIWALADINRYVYYLFKKSTLTSFLIIDKTQTTSNLTRDPPKTVEYVDLDSYLGVWYEQAAIPVYYQNTCQGVTRANYSRNADQTIRGDNKCYRNGVLSGGTGKAYPDKKDTSRSNAKLKVQFLNSVLLSGNYWIVRLDKDYTHVVVSTPTYSNLWILSRQLVIDQNLYDSIVADLKNDGFPVEKLKRTKQY